MISFVLALVWASPQATRATDTIVVAVNPRPAVDGRAGDDEYGAPAARIETAAGVVPIWIARHDGFIYIAAELPDSTFYWGDAFVIGLDADGSGDVSPQPGDRQWYLRRVLDSSTVVRAVAGYWNVPGQQPPMLGPVRHDADWDVASTSTASGWCVELRIRESVLDGDALPRIAFRTYNDNPPGWWSWPLPPGIPAQRVERSPVLWTSLRLSR